jgi:arylsulfatase A-like enzyme
MLRHRGRCPAIWNVLLVASLSLGEGIGSIACRRPAACPAERPHLLLISLDACRADHLGAYGYHRDTSPFLDRLAAEGLRFANAFVNTHGTPPSHATILSSLYQETHRVQHNARRGRDRMRLTVEVPLVQEQLRRSGYVTLGITGGGWMSRELGFGRGFTAFDDEPRGRVGAGRLVQHVQRHLGEGRPIFAFFHTYAVHSPYSPPEPYRRRWGEFPGVLEPTSENLAAMNAGKLPFTATDVRRIEALYDGGIRHADDALRSAFGRLAELGFLDNCLVVLTSDHGEELGERGGFLHRDLLYDDLIRVPLILWGKSVPRGRVEPGLASSVDIAPTLLAAAGVRVPELMEGHDLLAARAETAVFAQLEDRRYAVRTADWKLIVSARPPSRELYDLRSDPRERHNVARRFPAVVQSLEEDLRAWKAARPSLRPSAQPSLELSEDVKERLRSLGYVE